MHDQVSFLAELNVGHRVEARCRFIAGRAREPGAPLPNQYVRDDRDDGEESETGDEELVELLRLAFCEVGRGTHPFICHEIFSLASRFGRTPRGRLPGDYPCGRKPDADSWRPRPKADDWTRRSRDLTHILCDGFLHQPHLGY